VNSGLSYRADHNKIKPVATTQAETSAAHTSSFPLHASHTLQPLEFMQLFLTSP
jgi:hypothetical protein